MSHKNKILNIILGLILIPVLGYSQVKIGDNPSLIDASSILELESSNKALVLTRLTDSQINALTPLEGAIVYNTDAQCVFVYDGIIWKNLCDEPVITISSTSPTNNAIGDFWFNDTDNVVSVWNGTEWLPININPRRGSGPPDASITNPLAGDIYVDQNNGDIFTFDGTNWIAANQNINANNGLSLSANTIQLGGLLINPTVITTDDTNTIALQGLQPTTLDDTNSIIVANNTTGVLQTVPSTSLVQQQQVVFIATDGQIQFTTPLSITDINKIDVYRNGARIAFTIINTTTIEVEPEAACFEGDEIRIVQLN